LNAAEKWVVERVTAGKEADLSRQFPEEKDRKLSAHFLEDLLTGARPDVTVNASFGPCLCSRPALISRVSSTPFAPFPRVIRTPVFSRAYSGPATLFKRIHKIKIRQSRSEVPKIFQKAETLLRF
jgi:hypothetical protein